MEEAEERVGTGTKQAAKDNPCLLRRVWLRGSGAEAGPRGVGAGLGFTPGSAAVPAATPATTRTTPTSGRATSSPAWTRACRGSAWARGGAWSSPHTWPMGRTEQVKRRVQHHALWHPLPSPVHPTPWGCATHTLTKWDHTILSALGVVGSIMGRGRADTNTCRGMDALWGGAGKGFTAAPLIPLFQGTRFPAQPCSSSTSTSLTSTTPRTRWRWRPCTGRRAATSPPATGTSSATITTAPCWMAPSSSPRACWDTSWRCWAGPRTGTGAAAPCHGAALAHRLHGHGAAHGVWGRSGMERRGCGAQAG